MSTPLVRIAGSEPAGPGLSSASNHFGSDVRCQLLAALRSVGIAVPASCWGIRPSEQDAPLGPSAIIGRSVDGLASGGHQLVVAGGQPGAGKTTYCAEIAKALDALLVLGDWFLIEEDCRPSLGWWDKWNMPLLEAVLAALLAGGQIEFAPYDPSARAIGAPVRLAARPGQVIVAEGVTLLGSHIAVANASLSLFFDAPEGIREEREVQRAINDRRYGTAGEGAIRARVRAKYAVETPLLAGFARKADWIVTTGPGPAVARPRELH